MTDTAPIVEEAALDALTLINIAKAEIFAFVKNVVDAEEKVDKSIETSVRKRAENKQVIEEMMRSNSPEENQLHKQISILQIKGSMYPFQEQNLREQRDVVRAGYQDYVKIRNACEPLLRWVAGSLGEQLEAALSVYVGGRFLRNRKAAPHLDPDFLAGLVADEICGKTDVGVFLLEMHVSLPLTPPEDIGAARSIIGWGNRCVKLAELWEQFLKDGKRLELPL